jgi:hypothetical protein
MNAEILGAMLRQGCCHFNFEYVLAIMETTLQEEVHPNEKLLEHLENFHKQCQKIVKNKVYPIIVNKLLLHVHHKPAAKYKFFL